MPSTVALPLYPAFLQEVPDPGYGAVDLRRFMIAGRQEGVFELLDYKCTPSGGLACSVAAGEALVLGDLIDRQGMYHQIMSVPVTVTFDAADVTNPRLDQIVLEIKDNSVDSSGLNVGQVRIVKGTATPGATKDNRLGAAPLPASSVRLSDWALPAGFGGPLVIGTHGVDRRPRVNGAFFHQCGSGGGMALPTVPTAAGGMSAYVELSGRPVTVSANGLVQCTVAAYRQILSLVYMDGATPPGAVADDLYRIIPIHNVFPFNTWAQDDTFVPAAGRHLIAAPTYANAAGVTHVGNRREIKIIEEVRPSAAT